MQRRFGTKGSIVGVEEKSQSGSSTELIMTFPGIGQAMSEKNYLFSNLRKKLASSERWIVQFDYRGHGDSEGGLEEATLSSMTSDALEVLSQVTRLDPPNHTFFIGNALGAAVALQAARLWSKDTGTSCTLLMISPPLVKLPQASEIIAHDRYQDLMRTGNADTQILFPGEDYYTLSDFDEAQLQYIARLGSHPLYLHGQKMSIGLFSELDRLDLVRELREYKQAVHVICGIHDTETAVQAREIQGVRLHMLSGYYYHQHPAYMDELLELVDRIINA